MGIKINISGAKISDNASVLNHASIKSNEDVDIELQDFEINGQAVLLDNLEINTFLEELNQEAQKIDENSDEYLEIQEILKVKQWNKKDFIKCIAKHVGDFSQGVLASVVANLLGKV